MKYRHLYELSKDKNLPEYNLFFVKNVKLNEKTYNEPRTAECAALIVSRNGDIPQQFDFCIYPRTVPTDKKPVTFLNKLSLHLDPLTFPIMFPLGDLGWNFEFKQNFYCKKILSPLQYYSCRLAYRLKGEFSPVLYCGRLTQQYVIQADLIISLFNNNNNNK